MEPHPMRKSHPIRLTDMSDANLSLERLRTWNCQNFTELLNKPKVRYLSYILTYIFIIEFNEIYPSTSSSTKF
jgi:hypothetical protein